MRRRQQQQEAARPLLHSPQTAPGSTCASPSPKHLGSRPVRHMHLTLYYSSIQDVSTTYLSIHGGLWPDSVARAVPAPDRACLVSLGVGACSRPLVELASAGCWVRLGALSLGSHRARRRLRAGFLRFCVGFSQQALAPLSSRCCRSL
jgi:hypothetical protein